MTKYSIMPPRGFTLSGGLYSVWHGMKDRCHNPNNKCYNIYGGRGIFVCSRWINGEDGVHPFVCFTEDMGTPPTPDHTLDRIDNDRGYSPENCKWATRLEQSANRRCTMHLTILGVTKTLTQWCVIFSIPNRYVVKRLKQGWDAEIALITPLNTRPQTLKFAELIEKMK